MYQDTIEFMKKRFDEDKKLVESSFAELKKAGNFYLHE